MDQICLDPPGQVIPPPLGHIVNKTSSPHRTKKCLRPPPPRIISGTALRPIPWPESDTVWVWAQRVHSRLSLSPRSLLCNNSLLTLHFGDGRGALNYGILLLLSAGFSSCQWKQLGHSTSRGRVCCMGLATTTSSDRHYLLFLLRLCPSDHWPYRGPFNGIIIDTVKSYSSAIVNTNIAGVPLIVNFSISVLQGLFVLFFHLCSPFFNKV